MIKKRFETVEVCDAKELAQKYMHQFPGIFNSKLLEEVHKNDTQDLKPTISIPEVRARTSGTVSTRAKRGCDTTFPTPKVN